MSTNRAVAEAIVRDLFTNGNSQHASRLVLTGDTPDTRDLGGWCEAVATDRVERILDRLTSRQVTIEDAMVIAGVSRRTIYDWIAKGRVAVARTPSGRVRILAESLRPKAEVPNEH